VKIRPYVEADFATCLDIYRENFKQRKIPDHYEDEFIGVIQDSEILTLLLENESGIVGCGSVCYEGGMERANLSFGLIHPNEQRKGYGSRLLVARIGLLNTNVDGVTVTLCATENSVGFYGRVVGFGEYGKEIDDYGNTFHWLYLPVSQDLILRSLQTVVDSGVKIVEGIEIPIRGEQAVRGNRRPRP
jgi:hypothetical protein